MAAPLKYAVVTFGCRVNQADSLCIEDDLRARGCTAVSPEEADLIVVNTCSVTASADQSARQVIRRMARANPAVRVVVTGCYATRRPEELSDLSNVIRVVGNQSKDALVHSIAEEVGLTTSERFGDGEGPCGTTLEPGVAGRTAFTLRVQTGCNERCSYCIIPRTRGACRSRPLEYVLRDVRLAVAAGYKEVGITGVHLGSYGRDLEDGSSLARLVRTLAAVEEDVLFRISSLEPMDCTDELVDVVASSPRIAPHFHLPLQSGSDDILRMMRRPYTASYYGRLVTRITTLLPDAAIGSDMIVGFPGETAEHFAETLAMLESIPLTYLHVFPYSDRPGTAASQLRPKVDGMEVRERARRVRAIGERMTLRFRESQIGRVARALTVDHGQSVVTVNYLKLRLDERTTRNKWVQVRVLPDLRGQLSSTRHDDVTGRSCVGDDLLQGRGALNGQA
jgi:threonylcarbamoyladenosine tRNA methylthiotransferase MtaB